MSSRTPSRLVFRHGGCFDGSHSATAALLWQSFFACTDCRRTRCPCNLIHGCYHEAAPSGQPSFRGCFVQLSQAGCSLPSERFYAVPPVLEQTLAAYGLGPMPVGGLSEPSRRRGKTENGDMGDYPEAEADRVCASLRLCPLQNRMSISSRVGISKQRCLAVSRNLRSQCRRRVVQRPIARVDPPPGAGGFALTSSRIGLMVLATGKPRWPGFTTPLGPSNRPHGVPVGRQRAPAA